MLTGEIRFAQKVGVAPSTTTMVLGGAGDLGVQCFPIPSPEERAAYLGSLRSRKRLPGETVTLQGSGRQRILNPYANEVEMRGLGVVSESYAWRTGRPYSLPPGSPRGTTALVYGALSGPVGVVDPRDHWSTGKTNRLRTHGTIVMRVNPRRGGGFRETLLGDGLGITSGEINRSLSGLGTIPNDDELARNLCYTPVHSGWIYGETPTGGKYYVDGLYGPAATLLAEDPAVVADLVKIQRRQMFFQGVSTFAIAGIAIAAIWGAVRGEKCRPARRGRRR